MLFRSRRFTDESVGALLHALATTLGRARGESERPLGELEVLSAAERQAHLGRMEYDARRTRSSCAFTISSNAVWMAPPKRSALEMAAFVSRTASSRCARIV